MVLVFTVTLKKTPVNDWQLCECVPLFNLL